MTNAQFPTTKGLNWTVRKNPEFSTIEKWNVSGKRVTMANFNDPRWNFDLSWDYLRDDQSAINAAFTDLRAIQGFFGAMKGKYDTWLFQDPDDNSVSNEWFGDGDGTTAAFQLKRSFGGMIENIRNLNGTPSIFINDWQKPTNWLKYSDDFTQSGSWGVGNAAIVTANVAIAPDGSLTADSIESNPIPTANSFAGISQPYVTSDGVTRWTYSFYVMGFGSTTQCDFGIYNSTDSQWPNQTPAIVSGQGTVSGGSGTLCSVTGLSTTSWTRVSVTINAAVASGKSLRAFIYPGASGQNGTTYSKLFIWRAQAESGTTATTPVKTTSIVPVGSSQLAAYTRTNMVTQSQTFSTWTNNGTSTTTNFATAPDGSSTATKLIDSVASSQHYLSFTVSGLTIGKTYTASVYVKAGTRNFAYVQLGSSYVGINLTTGAQDMIGGSPISTSLVSLGSGGWYRISVTRAVSATSEGMLVGLYATAATPTYVGTGTDYIVAWGAQCEAGSASRYIATTTGATSVTDFTINSTGLVTFAASPLVGSALLWSGNFLFRCAFVDDIMDAEQFLKKLWQLQSLQFRSVSQ